LFTEDQKYYALLTGISLGWLAILAVVLQVFSQNFIYPDSTTYLQAARQFYESFEPNDTRTMLLAAINGIPYLFGFADDAVFSWSIGVNIGSWVGVVLMLFRILRDFMNVTFAFMMSLLYVFCVGSAMVTFHLLADSVFTFFLFLSVFLLRGYHRYGKYIYLASAISVLLLSLLVKPAGKFLVIIAMVLFGGKIIRNFFSKSNLLLLLSLSFVVFQMALMKKHYGNFTLTYIDSFTYFNYLGTRADCFKEGTEFRQCDNNRYDYFLKFSPSQQKEIAAADAKSQLFNNTGNLFGAYLTNIWINSTHGSAAVSDAQNVNDVKYHNGLKFIFKVMAKIQIVMLSAAGIFLSLFFLFRFRTYGGFFAAIALINLYIIGISGVSSDQGDRFHIVIYPMVILLLGKFLADKLSIRH
jgi:hypothetical protein